LLEVEEFKQMQQEFEVNQLVGRHVEAFLPSPLFEKNTLHPMITWFVLSKKLLRLDFCHMFSEATSPFHLCLSFVSISFSFQNSRLSFSQLWGMMQDKSKGRKSIWDIRKDSKVSEVIYFDYVYSYFIAYLRAT